MRFKPDSRTRSDLFPFFSPSLNRDGQKRKQRGFSRETPFCSALFFNLPAFFRISFRCFVFNCRSRLFFQQKQDGLYFVVEGSITAFRNWSADSGRKPKQ